MIAKAGILNHTQFNGKFGCPRCLVFGETAQTKKVWVYRFSSVADQRTVSSRQRNLKLTEILGGPIMGIKVCFIFFFALYYFENL